MAKSKKVEETAAAETKAKKVRAPKEKKDSYLKNNYVEINNYDGVKTEAMHIRAVGTLVREVNEKSGEVCSTFIPGVKIKTKKDLKYLIIDKGPKSKKKAGDEDMEDEEDENGED